MCRLVRKLSPPIWKCHHRQLNPLKIPQLDFYLDLEREKERVKFNELRFVKAIVRGNDDAMFTQFDLLLHDNYGLVLKSMTTNIEMNEWFNVNEINMRI